MTRLSFLTLFLISLFISCDRGIDKSQVDQAARLNSPFSNFVLYRYHVANSTAFGGSGFTAFKLLPSNEECNYTDTDFYTFRNGSPLFVKWKNKDTLIIKCAGEGPLTGKQPFKKVVQKWKDWTFEIEYYSVISSGTSDSQTVKGYRLNPNSILFKTSTDSLVFNNNEVAIDLDRNQIFIQQFKIDTSESKVGLSITNYKLTMTKDYALKDFHKLQPFIKVNL